MTIPAPGVPAQPASPDFDSRVRACLLGGALGDQLGYAVEYSSWQEIEARFGGELRGFDQLDEPGHFSDDTQLTLYTLDGLTEAIEWANEGVAADEAACLWLAYLRWYATQDGHFPDRAPEPQPRWIDRQEVLHHRRSPGESCLSALATGEMGMRSRPLNPEARGSGALIRSAPFGLLPFVPAETVYKLTLDGAAITHGHPSARHSAAAFSGLLRSIVQEGASLPDAVRAAADRAGQEDPAGGVAAALLRALTAGAGGPLPPAELPDGLGAGWLAEEVLAVAVYAVLATAGAGTPQEHFRLALAAAVNHDGGSSSTGSVAGHLLGALYGEPCLPPAWLRDAEAPELVLHMAESFLAQVRAQTD
ncbi:ADP-ribosylglycohydrolase family protein [Arthrobacter sp. I2-34]|uniref:ADP-ribosylglycohydrolase family protein n=1 Tax=Arthrobacter hankyongi TaxID=2904801 RepID=A0ABS9LBH5_9MICC|nr:ADP-ribosylglycohydrolase family protein [Arthrobacter hankyongi]MCG2624031.1 ADP-ribosylglycohydrolase family protein [Arthrobacter hankyongi]